MPCKRAARELRTPETTCLGAGKLGRAGAGCVPPAGLVTQPHASVASV